MRTQDPRYLAHEFLNADWAPLTFAEVAEAMAGVKCSYIGSATLAENVDAVSLAPEVIRPVMDAARPGVAGDGARFWFGEGFPARYLSPWGAAGAGAGAGSAA